jgi:hypothetical protein
MRLPACLLAAAAATLASAAHAGDYGVSASVGTTGLSLHLSRALTPALNIRIGPSFLNYSTDTSTTNVNYDLKLKLRTFDALVDWFPSTGGQFRITAGLVYNGNRFDAVGRPNATGTFTLNGDVFTAAEVGTLNGRIDFRKIAPYIGIGWGNAVAETRGWGITADLGVMFQGAPRSNLASTGCTGSVALCTQLAADVAAENQSLKDKLRDYRYYPVARVGARYAF